MFLLPDCKFVYHLIYYTSLFKKNSTAERSMNLGWSIVFICYFPFLPIVVCDTLLQLSSKLNTSNKISVCFKHTHTHNPPTSGSYE